MSSNYVRIIIVKSIAFRSLLKRFDQRLHDKRQIGQFRCTFWSSSIEVLTQFFERSNVDFFKIRKVRNRRIGGNHSFCNLSSKTDNLDVFCSVSFGTSGSTHWAYLTGASSSSCNVSVKICVADSASRSGTSNMFEIDVCLSSTLANSRTCKCLGASSTLYFGSRCRGWCRFAFRLRGWSWLRLRFSFWFRFRFGLWCRRIFSSSVSVSIDFKLNTNNTNWKDIACFTNDLRHFSIHW